MSKRAAPEEEKQVAAKRSKTEEDTFESLTLEETGARPGDILVGISKSNLGAVLVVAPESAIIPPRLITYTADENKRLAVSLGHVPFFRAKTEEDRLLWIRANGRNGRNSNGDGEYDMLTNPDIKLRIISCGKSTSLQNACPDKLADLMDKPFVTAKELCDVARPESGGRSLFLLTNRWKIDTSYTIIPASEFKASNFPGVAEFNLVGPELEASVSPSRLEVMYVKSINAAFRVLKEDKLKDPLAVDRVTLFKALEEKKMLGLTGIESYTKIADHLSKHSFHSGAWKSLLQKCIRFCSIFVECSAMGDEFEDWAIPTPHFAVFCFACLLTHPGNLVPDIQRFVTGVEAALKRTIIALYEDASFDVSNEAVVTMVEEMAAAAWLVQTCPSWKPTISQVVRWANIVVYAKAMSSSFQRPDAKAMGTKPLDRKHTSFALDSELAVGRISAILDKVGSFTGDLAIVHHVAMQVKSGKEAKLIPSLDYGIPASMPIEHCVDQHWAPDSVYYMGSRWVRECGSVPRAIKAIFDVVTGKNPRSSTDGIDLPVGEGIAARKKKPMPVMSAQDIKTCQAVRAGQKAFFSNLMKDPPPAMVNIEDEEKKNIKLETELHQDWLSGLVGPVAVCKGTIFATINLNDRSSFCTVFRRPASMRSSEATKSAASAKLSAEEEKKARAEFMSMLSPSASSKRCVSLTTDSDLLPFPQWRSARVAVIDGTIQVKLASSLDFVPWETLRKTPLLVEKKVHDFLQKENLSKLFSPLAPGLKFALKNHLQCHFSSELRLPRLSRDGKSREGGYISHDDVRCFEVLRLLSNSCPGLLELKPANAIVWSVLDKPLFWKTRNLIIEALALETTTNPAARVCNLVTEVPQRPLYWYQKKAVEECLEREGQGNLLLQTTGTGKTAVAMSIMANMRKTNPEYMIVCTPKTAVAAIVSEAERWLKPEVKRPQDGIRILLAVASIPGKFPDSLRKFVKLPKDGAEFVPLKGGVTIVRHDDVRKCTDVLLRFAGHSLLVIDEMHKALNDSQRTSCLQQVAAVARCFLLMTGTLVPDANSHHLRWWMQRLCPFAVSASNTWVAMNTAINKQVDDDADIWVRENFRNSPWISKKAETDYLNLLSDKRGGNNPSMSRSDLMRAFDLCVMNSELIMARLTAQSIAKTGRGVYMVTKNKEHGEAVKAEVERELAKFKIPPMVKGRGVRLLSGAGDTIDLSPSAVESGKTPKYCVLISTLLQSEGFNAHHLGSMATTIFHDSFPTRAQHQGRVKRAGRRHEKIPLLTVTTGMQEWWWDAQADDSARAAVLQTLGDVIVQ